MSNSAALIFFCTLAMCVAGLGALIAVYTVRHKRAAEEARRVESARQESAVPGMVEDFPALFKAASEAAAEFADDESLKNTLYFARYYFQMAANSERVGKLSEAYTQISYAQGQLKFSEERIATLKTDKASAALLGISEPLVAPASDYGAGDFWFF